MKKGGPYTIREQEQRRLQVYKLYFEERNSALKIAEILEVIRNTVNEDVKYWHCQLSNFGDVDFISNLKKQIQRMEIQRDRFYEYLEDTEDVSKKIKLEKQISDIDNKLTALYSKGVFAGKNKVLALQSGISDVQIREFVLSMISSQEKNYEISRLSRDEIEMHIVRKTQRDDGYARRMFERMRDLGLSHCSNGKRFVDFTPGGSYDLERFANLRGYILDSTENDKEFLDSGLSDVDMESYIPNEPVS